MVLAPQSAHGTVGAVPLRAKVLSEADRARLGRAQAKIEAAEGEWAAVVRKLGIAACARELGITPQGLLRRVQKIEARS